MIIQSSRDFYSRDRQAMLIRKLIKTDPDGDQISASIFDNSNIGAEIWTIYIESGSGKYSGIVGYKYACANHMRALTQEWNLLIKRSSAA